MRCLRFRAPGTALPAALLIERADPDRGRDAPRDAVAGRLRRAVIPIDGSLWQPGEQALRDPSAPIDPGAALCLLEPSELAGAGTPFLAADRGALEALPRGESDVPEFRCRVLAASWSWRRAWLRGAAAGGSRDAFEGVVLEERHGIALFAVRGAASLDAVRAGFAAARLPILGDVLHGGRLVAGGLRVTGPEGPLPNDFWPDEPLYPGGALVLPVSQATLRVLKRGHPWVLRDEDTGDAGRFRAGAIVSLRGVGSRGRDRPDGGLARIDDDTQLVARVWSPAGARSRSVEARVEAALQRRAALGKGRGTTAYRLVHGEADGLPGLHVDRLGGLLRVIVRGAAGEALRRPVIDAIRSRLASVLGADPAVVVVVARRRPPGGALVRAEGVRLESGTLADPRPVVEECGLRFRIDPGLGEPQRPRPGVGLFLDQRENRRRLGSRVAARLASGADGGRYLNLFAHTGAFSAALLRSGAEEVTSVDLSARYLAWTEENLALNALPLERHRSVRGDARKRLAEMPRGSRFAGIVLDPPTAAAAGRRFFSVGRDLVPLLGEALGHLEPGGWLLVCRNDRARRGGLADAVHSAATRARVRLAAVETAGPGPDFPSLRGFPEGDPMHAVVATTAD